MANLIQQRVEQARQGKNEKVIGRVNSGWVVVGDVQFLPGYCLLLADPVVESLNDLSLAERTAFLTEMSIIGDVLQEITEAYRINYEILGNSEPALHAHIFPRYQTEPEARRRYPAWFYDWENAPQFNKAEQMDFMACFRDGLKSKGILLR